MALNTPTVLTPAVAGTTATSLTSASFTPTAGALMIMVATVSGGASATGTNTTISYSPGGVTFSNRFQATAAASSSATYVWWGVAAAATAGTFTVTFSGAPASAAIGAVQITDTNGSPTVSATNQVNGSVTTAGSLSLTLPAAPATTSYTIGAFGSRNQNAAMTAGTGYTAVVNQFGASPSSGLMIEHRTGSTSTTVNATGMGTVYSSGVGFEVVAAVAAAVGRVRRISKRR